MYTKREERGHTCTFIEHHLVTVDHVLFLISILCVHAYPSVFKHFPKPTRSVPKMLYLSTSIHVYMFML